MNAVRDAVRSWIGGTAAAIAIVIVIGVLPTRRLAGGEGFAAMATALGVAWLAAALGALPVLRAVAAGGSERPVAVVGQATAWRAGATAAGALIVVLGTELSRTVFMIWLALGYGALLVAETRWTTRWLRAGGA